MVYSTRRFVVCHSVFHFVLAFFSPFSIAITSLGEERANLSAFIIIIIIIKTLFSVGNTISYKLLFLEAHLTKYIQTMKICKQNKARTYIQFVQIRH